MKHKALLDMFQDSETWPYNDYSSFEEFIEFESPSIRSIEHWLRKQYGQAFDEVLAEYAKS